MSIWSQARICNYFIPALYHRSRMYPYPPLPSLLGYFKRVLKYLNLDLNIHALIHLVFVIVVLQCTMEYLFNLCLSSPLSERSSRVLALSWSRDNLLCVASSSVKADLLYNELHRLNGQFTRDSHYHKTSRTIRDRDQNEIKQSRSYLGLNQVIKECFK